MRTPARRSDLAMVELALTLPLLMAFDAGDYKSSGTCPIRSPAPLAERCARQHTTHGIVLRCPTPPARSHCRPRPSPRPRTWSFMAAGSSQNTTDRRSHPRRCRREQPSSKRMHRHQVPATCSRPDDRQPAAALRPRPFGGNRTFLLRATVQIEGALISQSAAAEPNHPVWPFVGTCSSTCCLTVIEIGGLLFILDALDKATRRDARVAAILSHQPVDDPPFSIIQFFPSGTASPLHPD